MSAFLSTRSWFAEIRRVKRAAGSSHSSEGPEHVNTNSQEHKSKNLSSHNPRTCQHKIEDPVNTKLKNPSLGIPKKKPKLPTHSQEYVNTNSQEHVNKTFQEHVNTNCQEPRHTLRNTKSQEHVNTKFQLQEPVNAILVRTCRHKFPRTCQHKFVSQI